MQAKEGNLQASRHVLQQSECVVRSSSREASCMAADLPHALPSARPVCMYSTTQRRHPDTCQTLAVHHNLVVCCHLQRRAPASHALLLGRRDALLISARDRLAQ